MKLTKMYLSVCCIFVLMIVFTILSIVNFNSKDASAQIPTNFRPTASVEMKISHQFQDDPEQENNIDSIKELKRNN